MANLLNNPTLTGFTLGRYFTEKNGQVGTIENPPGWEFICYPREADDPNKLPQSLHRDRGFVIAAGYRAWEGGFVQKGIQVQANQRYRMKVLFKPDINFTENRIDLTAITWRFRVVTSSGQVIEQDWNMTKKPQFKLEEEHEFVFLSTQAQTIDLYFMVRSVYAGNVADFNIYEMFLEPVDANYIDKSLPVTGTGSTTTSTSTATSSSTPPPTPIINSPIVSNVGATANPVSSSTTGPSGKDLGSVLSAAEIDTIVKGLRELATVVNPTAAAGLNTLAIGLERLK
jgi:hypothetical protein